MTASLLHSRCLHHADREAAARCPSCGHDFCRECVVEHGGRLLCSACLEATLAAAARPRRALLRRLARAAGTMLGLLLAWAFFFTLGDLLTRLPGTIHPVVEKRQ